MANATATNLAPGAAVMKRRGEAMAFLIWRAAQAVDWDCTLTEIARELGISLQRVHSTVKRKGWSHRFNPDAKIEGFSRGGSHEPGLCAMMEMER